MKKRQEKPCSKCGQEKEEKWKKTSYCGKCASAKARKWELNNKDKKQASIERRRKIRQEEKCLECGNIFQRFRGEKVCSRKCKLLNMKSVNESNCWIYPILGGRGYGQISFRGNKNKSAHRVSYLEFKGEIPEKMQVCHQCDTPSCVNPDHLFLGTAKENIHDGIKKGRMKHIGATGRDCKFTSLTDEQVEEMRLLYHEGFDYKRLSRIFNCQKDYASKIVRKKARNKDDL